MANFTNSPLSTVRSPIREIILLTIIASIGAPLLEGVFRGLFGLPGPQTLGMLSTYGMSHFWLWQPLTHLFLHGAPGMGITFGLLIEIAFHCYMIWALGTSVLDRIGSRPFLRLFFGTGVGAGLITGILMVSSGFPHVLGGSTPAILAILTLWTMLHPDAQLLLFFVLPISSRWVLGGTAAAISLVHLSQGDIIGWTWMISGMLGGYLYGAASGFHSPFPQTHKFDQRINHIWNRVVQQWDVTATGKIFDIKTGRQVANDEELVDAILEKIAKKGRGALTLRERWILYRASRRRRK
jgi:membrane associated rhomboid family serine protease